MIIQGGGGISVEPSPTALEAAAIKQPRPLRLLDLFSGIGGFSLGLERTGGFKTVAFCEIDPFCRRVLAKHWPEVPCYDDVRTLTAERLRADGIGVDVICGGFPCQDISKGAAIWNRRAGLSGVRSSLWREYVRLIRDLRPSIVLVENVVQLRTFGLDQVLVDLAESGYDADWQCLPASFVGAPTRRDRVWLAAYPCGTRVEGLLQDLIAGDVGSWGWRGEADLLAVAGAPFERCARWPQPLVRRVDARIPGRFHRLERLGNAVIPQIPELIGRAILATQESAA